LRSDHPAYERYGTDFINQLTGIFGFVVYDTRTNDFLVAAIRSASFPYTGRDEDGNLHVALKMKALIRYCRHIEDFPRGHYLTRVSTSTVVTTTRHGATFRRSHGRPFNLGALCEPGWKPMSISN
jgi:asparagine synthase (glutamine-hydrolysing)